MQHLNGPAPKIKPAKERVSFYGGETSTEYLLDRAPLLVGDAFGEEPIRAFLLAIQEEYGSRLADLKKLVVICPDMPLKSQVSTRACACAC